MMFRSGCPSSSLRMACLVFAGGLGVAGAFLTPARLTVEGERLLGATVLGAAGTDVSSRQRFETNPADVASRIGILRDQIRDAIWEATDSIANAVEAMPNVGVHTNKTLSRLGVMVEKIDDEYFSKYLSFGSTPAFQETLAAVPSATLEREAGTGVGVAKPFTGGKKPIEKGKDKLSSSASVTASSKISRAAGAAAKSVSASAGAAVVAESFAFKQEEMEASRSKAGTVKLDRPKQVQDVFDEVQKKAVKYYKSNIAAPFSSKDGVAKGEGETPLPEVMQALEAKLESLLEESKFNPRKLKKDQKSQLVEAIRAMEASYPADANPLQSPELSGQWSVVYSSSSRLLGRALRGVLTAFFKTSDPRQVVDTGASSVLNACRARLRLTPLAIRVAKKGTYRATAGRKVLVEMPPTKKGWLRRMLPSLRAGKVEAEVTYLSNNWRVCRACGATVAFRKSGGD